MISRHIKAIVIALTLTLSLGTQQATACCSFKTLLKGVIFLAAVLSVNHYGWHQDNRAIKTGMDSAIGIFEIEKAIAQDSLIDARTKSKYLDCTSATQRAETCGAVCTDSFCNTEQCEEHLDNTCKALDEEVNDLKDEMDTLDKQIHAEDPRVFLQDSPVLKTYNPAPPWCTSISRWFTSWFKHNKTQD